MEESNHESLYKVIHLSHEFCKGCGSFRAHNAFIYRIYIHLVSCTFLSTSLGTHHHSVNYVINPGRLLMIRRSGLQKEVLSTYRRYVSFNSLPLVVRSVLPKIHRHRNRALRIIRTKPVASQARFRTLIRWHFRRPQVQEEISPRNISLIEHLVRKGKRHIEVWENPGVKDIVLNSQMRSWEEGRRWIPRTQKTILD